jgi:uncharacterized repeat protein (TIGR03803 family)
MACNNGFGGFAKSPVTLVLMLGLVWFLAPSVLAQTFSVVHSFTGTDGSAPAGPIIVDGAGKVRGTTASGGDLSCTIDGDGCGAVVYIDQTTDEVISAVFQGADGRSPLGGLVSDRQGGFLGTTTLGGSVGAGSVFRIDIAGALHNLSNFQGGVDGANPSAALTSPDSVGNFYGTTSAGGANGFGVVFRVDLSGILTTLYSFTGGADGRAPVAALVRDKTGNLYGTAQEGGDLTCGLQLVGCGTVFRVDANGSLRVVHTFKGGKDGSFPAAALLVGPDGSIFGTTLDGGAGKCTAESLDKGCGVIFKITKTGQYSVLYTFTGGTDGAHPAAPLISDSSANLYGVASAGGPSCPFPLGCGTVFELTSGGTFTVLHGFGDVPDGASPRAIFRTPTGVLYGTTAAGGTGNGVVFKLIP